jgi:hypothetical protein
MSSSGTGTYTFSILDARKIAAHVAADMHLMNSYYGYPEKADIDDYLEEIAQHLSEGYLLDFEIGFERDGGRVFSLLYEALEDGTLSDNRAGSVEPGHDVKGAERINYLRRTASYEALSPSEKEKFKQSLPIQRTPGPRPVDGDGYWVLEDRSYASGGRGVRRRKFIPNG